ncbi:MAG: XrtA system polysaccharide deacetylase [Candidatus Omnitrophota bacterium]
MKNILTIDVEDYFQVENFKKRVKFADWENYEGRVSKNTYAILDILEGAKAHATFFILGWVAERYPRLVKDIHAKEHEVASHGYSHEPIYDQSMEDFQADLKKSKLVLEDMISEKIRGYRAPSFSMTEKTISALDVLDEEGFEYDSSIFPVHRDRGGMVNAKRFPHKLEQGNSSIWEIPISTMRLLGQNIPFSGGGYFRLLPYWLVKKGIEALNKENQPAIVYLHPWEIDPEQPRINGGIIGNFRHYINLDKTERKLEKLLNDFEFGTVRSCLDSYKS